MRKRVQRLGHRLPKRSLSLVLLLLLCLAMCGCWDYRGLNKLIFVSGIAVDKNPETGDFIVTYEIMNLQGNIKQEGLSAKIVESTGRTIAEAVRNANRRVTYKLYFGHSTVLILSEEVAIDGDLEELLDWVLRESEMRETASIVISVGQPAGDLLKLVGLDQNVVANEIDKILAEDSQTASLTYHVEAFEAYNLLKAEGRSLALPVFHEAYNDGDMVAESNGVAVFKDTVMLGTLSPLESRMLLFMLNDIKGGLLICDIPEEKKHFSLLISESKTRLTYEEGEDGQLIFRVKIKMEARLSQTDTYKNMLDAATIERYERYATGQLKADLETLVQRVQQEYDSDIFGLGNHIFDTNNRLWKKISGDWDTLFQNARVIVEPDITVISTEYEKS
ncbi:MAG: Ger(x)C family spore germination protein [Clostridiaceae bacterium]|nr:Ger(x)C family spore germination protein [Eubacteriales bacterium]